KGGRQGEGVLQLAAPLPRTVMDWACVSFFILVLVLLAVMVLGHGMWLVCAAALRPVMGQKGAEPRSFSCPRERRRRGPIECLRCGYPLPAEVADCPRCGLDCEGVVAAELADLEAVARQLERFRRAEEVPAEVLNQFWAAVQERHERL